MDSSVLDLNNESINESNEVECFIEMPEEKNILNEISEKYGYGWLVWKAIIVAMFNFFVHGLNRVFMSAFLIPVKLYFDVGDSTIKWILFSSYFAMGSALIFQFIKVKREMLLYIISGMLILAHVLLFNHSLSIFILSRIIGWFASGIGMPISSNILVESLPVNYRGIVLNSLWFAFGAGISVPIIVMLIVMPNMEPEKLQTTYLVLFSIPIACVLVNIFMFNNSPRNLLLNEQNEEAFELLEKMNGKPLTDKEKSTIIKQFFNGANTQKSSFSLKDMFTRYRRISILMILVTSLLYLTYNGLFSIQTLTLKELLPEKTDSTQKNTNLKQVLIEQLTISLLSELYLFFGFLTEIRCLGRVKTMIIAIGVAIVFNILFLIFPQNANIFLGIFFSTLSLTVNIVFMYNAEVYPTSLRDTASVAIKSIGFFLGALNQILFIHLHDINVFIPYYVCLAYCILIFLLFFLFPETCSKNLDSFEEQEHID